MEYLFSRCEISEEYYCTNFGNVWYVMITTEKTARKHRLIISKQDDSMSIMIRKERAFNEAMACFERRVEGGTNLVGNAARLGEDCGPLGEEWRMRTAVEGGIEARLLQDFQEMD